MKYHQQRFRHNPDAGVYGDCFRTALACLMDMERDDVPHFMEGNPSADAFWSGVNTWLKGKGLALFSVAYQADLDGVLAVMKAHNPGMYYMLAGESSRGTAHQVVAFEDAIVHDPSIDGGGLVGPCQEDGLFWVNVLVPAVFHTVP